MPVVTGTCLTLPALYTNTNSLIGAAICGLLSSWFVAFGIAGAFFSTRVVTDWMGTVNDLAWLVLISTVAVSPGLKGDGFSAVLTSRFLYESGDILTLTVKLVTWSALVPTTLAELPISVTTPVKSFPKKASTCIFDESPNLMRLMSFSFTSTFTSSWLKSDMVMISVPANCCVPSTRSPFWIDNFDTTPSTGE